jgi:hypothetical protein
MTRWMRRSFVVLLFLIGGLSSQTSPVLASPPSPKVGPPSGLTSQGRLLWEFEGLLGQTFSSNSLAAIITKGVSENFSCEGDCSPLSTYSPYWLTFQRHSTTTFQLTSHKPANGSLGNYPLLILVKGKAILCNNERNAYLATYSDGASFTLVCVIPLPS